MDGRRRGRLRKMRVRRQFGDARAKLGIKKLGMKKLGTETEALNESQTHLSDLKIET